MAKGGRRPKAGGKGSSRPASTGALPVGSRGDASGRFRPDRRFALRCSLGAIVLGGTGWALHRHDAAERRRHDLGAIGAGRPVVVQVHDPSCPSCRSLMAATDVALEAFPGVDYRVADLTGTAGREFGARHRASKVTLLLFDARGGHLETIAGVRTPEALRAIFAAAFGEAGVAAAASS